MTGPIDIAERIARAKAYPFGHPTQSYLFRSGQAEPLIEVSSAIAARIPVLASGSNAAPAQLARKFAAYENAAIPVTRAEVHDFDSVYNAHIAAYGSIPATLFPSPGTLLSTFITWLDERELEIMHATEQPGVNYHFTALRGIGVEVEGLGALSEAYAYISVAGCFSHDGGPVALAEVPAERRRYPVLSQPEMLALVRDLVAPGVALDAFILETVSDAAMRLAHSTILARTALPFAYASMEVVEIGRRQAPKR